MPVSRQVKQVSVESTEKSPFGRLVAQGSFYSAGMQMGSGAVVLPVICAHQGLTWVAGLLFPAFCIGAIIGNSTSPLILQRAGRHRHLLMSAISATAAVLVVCNATVPWTGVLVAAVFLVTASANGVVAGVSGVAYTDMIASKLSALRRGELLLTQGAVGSVLATTLTLVVVPLLAHGDEMARYRDLLWLGAAGLVISSIAALFVGPLRPGSVAVTAKHRPLKETYRQGFAVARSQPWFRRYATTYLLFAPISLGTMFYSLRAAQSSSSLHVLVIISSVALVVGSVLWRQVNRLFGVRGMLLGSASLSTSSALLCIAAELSGQWFHTWAYGTAFFLATVAAQTVVAASISWISMFAAEQHRATLICFGSTLAAITSTVLGALLGELAQKHATIWPVTAMLALAVIAAFASLRAPGRVQVTESTSPSAESPQPHRSARPGLGAHVVIPKDRDGALKVPSHAAVGRRAQHAYPKRARRRPFPIRPATTQSHSGQKLSSAQAC
ncbi:hypothetical protein MB901379_02962 [Mycobacterium basiliense]|uniref:Major Facilitator Superfamily protein n=1 Tax=Mycobacterium basiliense TaxID=2094119 RepID=A0A447GFY7_9MYCO|nr:MFS transporter [Mycobacterium basiliense]VDM89386.1 hypothetical protein MB901379_02962 [Mycobacterium basiliense]